MLLRENGRRHQDGHLLAVLDGLERGTHGDLGLAVADVADDDAVHRDRTFHVGLDLGDDGQLIDRLGEVEGVFHLLLPRGGVGPEGVTRGGSMTCGVELYQLTGDLANGLARLALRVLPVRPAELGQRGCSPPTYRDS